MLFENRTSENIKVRVLEKASQNLHGWRTVRPNKTINLQKEYGLKMNLTPAKDAIKESDNIEDQGDSLVDMEKAEWMEEIIAVKNVGQKTADDIIAKYPTRDSMKKAVKDNEHLVMKDDVAAHFTDKYGEDDENDTG